MGRFEILNPEEVNERGSVFGNDYFTLTKEEIEALKNGKTLFYADEYGIFINFEDGSCNNG